VRFDATRGLMEIEVKNRFAVSDRLECVHPSGNHEWALACMEDPAGEAVAVAPGNGHRVWLELPPEKVGAYIARFV
jgi:putative protease